MATIDIFKFEKNTVSFEAGTVIFRQGDASDVMYVVQSGEAEIRVNDKVIETVGAGGVLGEMALIESAARSATVIAKTDCVLVPLDENGFTNHVHRTPFFALQVMRVMAARLRKMNELL